MDIPSIIIQIFVIVFAVSIHEVAHGWVAYKLGDPTAYRAGRLTMNPIPHIDPIWSLLVPAIMMIWGGPIFGMAKPVPVNPSYFRNPRRDYGLVSVAGPLSNLGTAIVAFALFSLLRQITSGIFITPVFAKALDGLFLILKYATYMNAILAVFNLIPLPPFDGSWILSGLLSKAAARKYEELRPYGIFIFILVVISRIPYYLFTPIISLISRLLR